MMLAASTTTTEEGAVGVQRSQHISYLRPEMEKAARPSTRS